MFSGGRERPGARNRLKYILKTTPQIIIHNDYITIYLNYIEMHL